MLAVPAYPLLSTPRSRGELGKALWVAASPCCWKLLTAPTVSLADLKLNRRLLDTLNPALQQALESWSNLPALIVDVSMNFDPKIITSRDQDG